MQKREKLKLLTFGENADFKQKEGSMTTTTLLLNQLEKLRKNAVEQTNAYKTSRQLLRENLAATYMWWRDAKKHDEFLQNLYDHNEIRISKLQGGTQENFIGVLRLIWDIDHVKYAATLTQWNVALRNLHDEYEANKRTYEKEPVKQLAHYIDQKQGVRGLAGVLADTAEEADANEANKKSKSGKSSAQLLSRATLDKEHVKAGLKYYDSTKKTIAVVKPISAVAINEKNYTAALLRHTANGYVILSTSARTDLIEQLITDTYKRSATEVPYQLLTLSQIIATQCLPASLQRFAKRLHEQSAVKAQNDKKMNSLKRLVLREDGTLLLSLSRTACSVVTVAKPIKPIAAKSKQNIFLRINDRTFVETELLQTKDLVFWRSSEIKRLETTDGAEANNYMQLTNVVTKKVRNLYFYGFKRIAEGSRIQASYKAASKPIWSHSLNTGFFVRLQAEFLTKWISGLGPNIKRPTQNTLMLQFKNRQFQLRYQYEHDKYQQQHKQVLDSASKAWQGKLLSKELVPALVAIAEADVVGAVSLSATASSLTLKYKTTQASYSVHLPLVDERNKRLTADFAAWAGI